MTNYEALDTFMSLYMGPDSYYLSGTTDVDQSIDFYLESEDDDTKYQLLSDFNNFVNEYTDDLSEKFNRRYRHSIHDKDDVKNFLQLVNQKVLEALGQPVKSLFSSEEKSKVLSLYRLKDTNRTARALRTFESGQTLQITPATIYEPNSPYLVQAVAALLPKTSLVLSKTSRGIVIAEVRGTTLPVVSDKGVKVKKSRNAVRQAISEAAAKRDKQRS